MDNKGTRGIRGDNDVWALGCVASEALVWCLQGDRGRWRYHNDRIKATQQTVLKDGCHVGAFHDGTCVLNTVEDWHQNAIKTAAGDTDFYTQLSNLILGRMLVAEPKHRVDAAELYNEWNLLFPSRPVLLPTNHTDPGPSTHSKTDGLECLVSDSVSQGPVRSLTTPAISATPHESRGLHIITTIPEDNFLSPSPSPGHTPSISITESPQEELPEEPPRLTTSLRVGRTYEDRRHRSVSPRPSQVSNGKATGHSVGSTDRNSIPRRHTLSDSGVGLDSRPQSTTQLQTDSMNTVSKTNTIIGMEKSGSSHSARRRDRSAQQSFANEVGSYNQAQLESNMTSGSRALEDTYNYTRSPSPSDRGSSQHTVATNPQSLDLIATVDLVWHICLADKTGLSKYLNPTPKKQRGRHPFKIFPQLAIDVNKVKGDKGRDQVSFQGTPRDNESARR